MSGVSASPPTFSSFQVKTQTPSSPIMPIVSNHHPLYSSDLKLKGIRFGEGGFQRIKVVCNNSRPGGSGPGESDSRSVLDAFFLGKAVAEALNERIESTVGEFLSAIGRLQAVQQKQVQNFQEEVLERAKRAKEKAAHEAMEGQGFIPKSTTANTSAVADGVNRETSPSPSNSATSTVDTDPDPTNKDSLLGVSNDD